MDLKEAIMHLQEKISEMQCSKCKEEHEQLLEWLRELELMRMQYRIPPCLPAAKRQMGPGGRQR